MIGLLRQVWPGTQRPTQAAPAPSPATAAPDRRPPTGAQVRAELDAAFPPAPDRQLLCRASMLHDPDPSGRCRDCGCHTAQPRLDWRLHITARAVTRTEPAPCALQEV
jgi:hypothetical protein